MLYIGKVVDASDVVQKPVPARVVQNVVEVGCIERVMDIPVMQPTQVPHRRVRRWRFKKVLCMAGFRRARGSATSRAGAGHDQISGRAPVFRGHCGRPSCGAQADLCLCRWCKTLTMLECWS